MVDDKTVPGAVHPLGEVTWVKEGTEHGLTYSLELEGLPGQCVDYTNTETIEQTGQTAEETVTVCAPLGVTVERDRRRHLRPHLQVADRQGRRPDRGRHRRRRPHLQLHRHRHARRLRRQRLDDAGRDHGRQPQHLQDHDRRRHRRAQRGGGAARRHRRRGRRDRQGRAGRRQGRPATETATTPAPSPPSPGALGGITARATWDGGYASSIPTAVPFTLDDETDKTITVHDDKTQPGQSFLLGTADWTSRPSGVHLRRHQDPVWPASAPPTTTPR